MVGNTNTVQTTPTEMFKVQAFTSSTLTLNSGDGTSTTVSITVPSGYMILGVLGTQPNGAVVITFPYNTHLLYGTTGTQSLTVWGYNQRATTSTFSISAIVLFVKK